MGKQLKIVLRGGGRKRKKSYASKMHFLMTADESGGYDTKLAVIVTLEDLNVIKKKDDTKNGSNRMTKLSN